MSTNANPLLNYLRPAPDDPSQPLQPIQQAQDQQGQLQSINARTAPAQASPLAQFKPNPVRQQTESYYQGRLDKLNAPREPAQGFWGKTGRILENIGNVAGDIFAPATMALIPGTQLNKIRERGSDVRELSGLQAQDTADQEAFGREQLQGAQTSKAIAETPTPEQQKANLEHTEAETESLGRPDLAHAYASAVTSAMQKGVDPSQDPVVQHIADAITGIQKSTVPAETQTKTADILGHDGKEHIMGWNPQTKKYDVDMGLKGEKPAQAPGVTVMVPNADGGYSVQRAGVGQNVAPGAVTAAGMNSLNVPTSSTRTMVETAPRVIELADRVEQLIDPQVQTLGPAASRWAEFMAGKVGAPNPEFTKLRTNVGLLSTALMRMHVGARGGEQIMQHFQDLMDSSKQSPENLKAALDEIKSYAHQVAGEAGPGHGGTANPSNGAKGQQGADMIRARDPQGNLHEAPKGTALPKGWTLQ